MLKRLHDRQQQMAMCQQRLAELAKLTGSVQQPSANLKDTSRSVSQITAQRHGINSRIFCRSFKRPPFPNHESQQELNQKSSSAVEKEGKQGLHFVTIHAQKWEHGSTMTSTETAPDLKFEIKNVKPIELIDLTNSLLALGNEYQNFISKQHPEAMASDVKLYINEVRSGSVIALLTAMTPQLMDGFSYVNTVVDFASFLKSAFALLGNGQANKNTELSPATLSNLSQIVEPVAKDSGAQLNIGTLNVTGNVYLSVPSKEANVIQNQISHIDKERRAKTHGLHEKVLLHWYQARKDTNNKFGDKAIIEAISPNPVKVICANDELKARMVLSEKNPFNEAFIVDVVSDTLNEKIVLYKIVELHERFLP